jgi:hypothetical protein
MRAVEEGTVEAVAVVASGALDREEVDVGAAASGALPMMRERYVCQDRRKLRLP